MPLSGRELTRQRKKHRKLRAETPLKFWTVKDIAFHFEVTPRTARSWTYREGFPKPAAVVSGYQKIYWAFEVQEWVNDQLHPLFGKGTKKPGTKRYR